MVRRKSGEDLFGSARWHFHVAGFIGTPQHPHTNCLFIISILHFSLCLTPSACSPIVHRIGCQCAQLNTMDCKSLLVLGLLLLPPQLPPRHHQLLHSSTSNPSTSNTSTGHPSARHSSTGYSTTGHSPTGHSSTCNSSSRNSSTGSSRLSTSSGSSASSKHKSEISGLGSIATYEQPAGTTSGGAWTDLRRNLTSTSCERCEWSGKAVVDEEGGRELGIWTGTEPGDLERCSPSPFLVKFVYFELLPLGLLIGAYHYPLLSLLSPFLLLSFFLSCLLIQKQHLDSWSTYVRSCLSIIISTELFDHVGKAFQS
ncbi:unnamed protein product, partial [Vitis vinifera]